MIKRVFSTLLKQKPTKPTNKQIVNNNIPQEDIFKHHQLQQQTLYHSTPNSTTFIGPHVKQAFYKLTNKQPTSTSLVAKTNNNELVVLNKNLLEIYSPLKINYFSLDFIKVEKELFMKRMYEQELKFKYFPQVEDIFRQETEDKRRKVLQSSGAGLSLFYACWYEQLVDLRDLLIASNSYCEELVYELVKGKLEILRKQVKEHFKETKENCVVSLISSDFLKGSGKTTFLNTLSQSTINENSDINLRVSNLPITISPQSTSSDLKLIIIDMDKLYTQKSKSQISKIIDKIDQDTLIILSKKDTITIRTPSKPGKMRLKNSPLSPQTKRTAQKGRIPLRLDGDVSGNEIDYGDYGLRCLEDTVIKESCLLECRSTIHRQLKKVKGAKFWIKVVPNHPRGKKPLGVRMGKGKSAFDHYEAKVPNGVILFEIGGGVKEEFAKDLFRSVMPLVPSKCEVVVAEKEESLEDFCKRVEGFCKVKGKGVWCLSAKTGEGMDEFLLDFSNILREKYGLNEASSIDGELSTLRYRKMQEFTTIMENINLQETITSNKESLVNSINSALNSLDPLIDLREARDAVDYYFHSKYGILKHNKEMKAFKRLVEEKK